MFSSRSVLTAFGLLAGVSLFDNAQASARQIENCRLTSASRCYIVVDRRVRRHIHRQDAYRVTGITDDRVHPADYGPFYPTRRYYYRYPFYSSPFAYGFWWW
jgi:hypothetical protein